MNRDKKRFFREERDFPIPCRAQGSISWYHLVLIATLSFV